MALDSTAVTNNANGKLIQIERILDNRSISTPLRMELILKLASEWDAETSGSVERCRTASVIKTATKARQYLYGASL